MKRGSDLGITPSWDGLEDIVPEGYRNRVREYLEEAAQRIDELGEEDPSIKTRTNRKIGRYKTQKVRYPERRRLVLQCLALGMRYPEIEKKLELPRNTVNNDLAALKQKFNCKTTVQLMARALRTGFIE